jgi:hypothetical protein
MNYKAPIWLSQKRLPLLKNFCKSKFFQHKKEIYKNNMVII